MDKKQRATTPNRETRVVSSEVKSGADFGNPFLLADNKLPEDVKETDWFAVITKKTGMGDIRILRYAYETKSEAEEQVRCLVPDFDGLDLQ